MNKKKLLPFKILFFTSLGLSAIAMLAYMIMNNMDIPKNATWRFSGGKIVVKHQEADYFTFQ